MEANKQGKKKKKNNKGFYIKVQTGEAYYAETRKQEETKHCKGRKMKQYTKSQFKQQRGLNENERENINRHMGNTCTCTHRTVIYI